MSERPQRWCTVAGCGRKAGRLGYCRMHLQRIRRNGDPMVTKGSPGASARFAAKYEVEPESGCWVWISTLDKDGYGRFSVRFDFMQAHRWSYEHYRGPIPSGLVLDHVVCDRPGCVNPWHVEPRTAGQNVLRGSSPSAKNARKTHCIHGHELVPENVYSPPKAPRRRLCRICIAERHKKRKGEAA